MALSRGTVDEERKSYSAVFLLGVGLLLAGGVWAVWDDNIARRPWKKYQTEFYTLQIDRAREVLAKEKARLEADPEYQQLSRELAAARASLAAGDAKRRLDGLHAQRVQASVRVDDEDLALRIVKSQIEEAWYEYDHAVLTRAPIEGPRAHLKALEQKKAAIEESLNQAQGRLRQIDNEIAEVRSAAKRLEDRLSKLGSERDRLQQRLDNLTSLQVGPVQLPKIPKIEQVVLREFDRNPYDQAVARVDRCQSCHAAIDKAGFESDPNPFRTHPRRDTLLAKHPVEKFGCTPCHGGQGAAVNSVAAAHGEVRFWEHPLRHADMVEASCISCHADMRMPGAETIALGESLFEQLGCHGCHLVEGYGELDKIGPSLRRLAAKDEPGWLVRWIESPHKYRPHTRMPDFAFSASQATAIASYLLDASRGDSQEWLSRLEQPAGIDPRNPALVAKGKELSDSLGCRGCHGFADGESPALIGDNKDIAPNLARIAEKTDARWLYHWLKDPRGFSPETRMPSLRLSDEEATALASYLLTLGTPRPAQSDLIAALQAPERVKEGAALVRKYGCSGCHNIPGMEAESRIGVELTTFGSKPLEELFFGNHTDIPLTWRDWTYNKLKEPRTYATDRIEQLMPQFELTEANIHALVVFLSSRVDERVPETYRPPKLARERRLVEGRRVVAKYNCVGCHVIERQGGAILARYEEAPTMAPPVLNGEGAKVQPNWLFGFLRQPVPVRPWLKVRMPTFGLSDKEIKTLIEYFLTQDAVEIPFVYVNEAAIPPEHVEAGRLLASADYFNCFSCHQQGEKKPEGPQEGWAPDLAMAKERLNPEWIVRWLRDPQVLQPGTKMPSFYNFNEDEPGGPDDVLGGDDAKQVEALRNYILTLHRGAKPAAPLQTAAADGALAN